MSELTDEIILLRVFVSETDTYRGKPVYRSLIEILHREKISGATVLRGILGFGARRKIHSASILRLSQDLPMVIEAVGTQEEIDRVLPKVEQATNGGLITLERVQILNRKNQENTRMIVN